MKEVISHQKAKAITGEYFSLLKEGSEYPVEDGRWVGYSGSFYYIRVG